MRDSITNFLVKRLLLGLGLIAGVSACKSDYCTLATDVTNTYNNTEAAAPSSLSLDDKEKILKGETVRLIAEFNLTRATYLHALKQEPDTTGLEAQDLEVGTFDDIPAVKEMRERLKTDSLTLEGQIIRTNLKMSSESARREAEIQKAEQAMRARQMKRLAQNDFKQYLVQLEVLELRYQQATLNLLYHLRVRCKACGLRKQIDQNILGLGQ